MTERKPVNASWESWIERQIQDGRRDGAFDDLSGAGRPIAHLDRPHDEHWWIREKLRRENVDVTPPTIAIRMDRDVTLVAALEATSESEVRDLIHGLNERIAYVNSHVTFGPPSTLSILDPDAIVERWHAAHPAPPADSAGCGPPGYDRPRPPVPPAGVVRRRWRRFRR